MRTLLLRGVSLKTQSAKHLNKKSRKVLLILKRLYAEKCYSVLPSQISSEENSTLFGLCGDGVRIIDGGRFNL